MATVNDYSFQTSGVVLIGTTTLNNVTNANVSWELEENISTRISAGDTHAKEVEGSGKITCTVTLDMYDENGLTGALDDFLIGATSGKNQTITLRPDGVGTGKKQLILDPPSGYRGMTLTSSSLDMPTGDDSPPVTGNLVFKGGFSQQSPWTAQA